MRLHLDRNNGFYWSLPLLAFLWNYVLRCFFHIGLVLYEQGFSCGWGVCLAGMPTFNGLFLWISLWSIMAGYMFLLILHEYRQHAKAITWITGVITIAALLVLKIWDAPSSARWAAYWACVLILFRLVPFFWLAYWLVRRMQSTSKPLLQEENAVQTSLRKSLLILYWSLPVLMYLWDALVCSLMNIVDLWVNGTLDITWNGGGRPSWLKFGWVTFYLSLVSVFQGYFFLWLISHFKRHSKVLTIVTGVGVILYSFLSKYLFKDLEGVPFQSYIWNALGTLLYYVPFFWGAYYLLRRMDRGVKGD